MAITWTSTAINTSEQFGNSYCPQFQAVVNSTPISADKCKIEWTINYITHGYVFYCTAIRVNLDIAGNVVFDDRISINQRSGYEVASGSFEMSRGESEQEIYPNMWINWAAVSPTWNGTTKSSNESCASDYFRLFAKLIAPTAITATYNGTSAINVNWSGAANCSKYQLQRRDNDDATWTTIASNITTTSYTDSGIVTTDKLYYYRVAASDDTVWSNYKTSSVIATKPAPPFTISLAYGGGVDVVITLENTSKIATGLEVQYSADKSTWTAAANKTGLVTSLTYTETNPGTYYFRARNIRGSLSSSWIVSANAIAVKTKPNKPVWNSNTMYVDYAQGDATLKFKYSSDDKAPIRQMNWTLAYNGNTSTGYQNYTGSEYIEWIEFPFSFSSGFSYGKSATIQITVTNENGTSEKSDVLTVNFAKASPIYISGINANTYSNYPIELRYWTDANNLQTNIYVYKKGSDKGKSIATVDGKKTYIHNFVNKESYDFEDGATYIAYAEAADKTTGLISKAQVEFYISWLNPITLIPTFTYDNKTGCLTVTATKDSTTLQRVEPSEWILYSIVNGERVELFRTTDLSDSYTEWKVLIGGSNVYEIVSIALNGLTSSSGNTPFNYSKKGIAYFYYYPIGSETLKVAATRYNQSEDISLTQPNRKQVYYAGRMFPLSYNNTNRGDSRSISAYLTSQEEIDSWIELWKQGGRCVFKTDTEIFECDADVSFSPAHRGIAGAGELKVTVTRLDDEVK